MKRAERQLSYKDEIASDRKPKFSFGNATLALRFGILILLSVLFAISGPFGTYEAGDFGERLLYWAVLIFVSVAIAFAIIKFNTTYLSRYSLLTQESLSVLLMTVIFTGFLQGWTEVAFPGMVNDPPGYTMLASKVLVICAAVSLFKHWLPYAVGGFDVAEDTERQPRLARRLPQDFSGRISRLTVNGHKVLVVTSQGTFDLRMRFADAVEEITELDGFCTHRSHWVNQAAIRHVDVRNGKPVIVMDNCDEVPVSRKYQSNVEDAGFL